MDPLGFRIGRSDREHITVSPSPAPRDEAADCWDGNWVDATITAGAGGFRAEVFAQLRAEDFVSFRDQLRPLHEHLVGRASFGTMEGWLSIAVEGDGRGHLRAECVLVDLPGTGNQLTFGIDFDQTDLPDILRDLDAITRRIPVIGAP